MEVLTDAELHVAEGLVFHGPGWNVGSTTAEAVRKLLSNYKESLAAATPRMKRSEPGGYDSPVTEKLRKK